ncbi:MAG: CDP-glycerol glycerophosphotransferase family protein [Paraprevotella sp.]|nr:CDP-glycerol glycerophosphotransferase family protein [Paraprevotella sp.]
MVSHLGKNYSCNPKYLCEYLLANHRCDLQLIYLYDPTNCSPDVFPEGVTPVSIYSKRFAYEMATCGWFVSNTRIPDWFRFNPRKGQHYIQTWHSSLRLKMIEGDSNLGKNYETMAKADSAKISAIVSGCRFSSDTFHRAFWYNGKLLEYGTPRIDYLLNLSNKEKSQIYAKARLSSEVHYVLYAPTFRKGGDLSAYSINYNALVLALRNKFGGEWKILFRLHPNLKDTVNVSDLGECCIDMTNYSDIQELIVLSDILITDYSSCMFDMAFMKKLCILYASDLDYYLANERNLYFDIKSLPFPLAQNNRELAELIDTYSENNYQKILSVFMQSIGSFEDGKACERIAEYIIQNND